MATIIREYQTGIGWAVDYISGGKHETLYFASQPDEATRDGMIEHYDSLDLESIVVDKRLDEEETEE